ncbi:MAG: ribosome biogenesis GTP-binding protein YihA/YsxC [Ignavibacteria bacterium]|nr:ribosome biogenesis GTP-binding protein YihA/YsxC [Ignavibacteria bacterium]
MKIDFSNAKFSKSFYNDLTRFNTELPEIVFVGRSNVGKSTLLNSLTNKKGLAKVSQTPGKTRSINYYNIDNKLYFVDLPGYGFSKASKTIAESYSKLIERYFDENSRILLVCHLIDSRHEPTLLDEQLKNFIVKLNYPYCILFTKIDKLKQSEKALLKKRAEKFLNRESVLKFFSYSSITKEGKKELLQFLNSLYLEYKRDELN